jgi:phosphatidylglycerophosphate synthase
MKGPIWTVPNQITLLRLGFLPFFLILISYEQYRWALLMVAVVILLISGYRPFPPSIYGKLTTALQILLVFMVVLAAAYPHPGFTLINRFLVYAVTGFTVFSAFHYSFTTSRRLSTS